MPKKKDGVWMLLIDMTGAMLRSACRMQLFSNKAVGSAGSETAFCGKPTRV